MKFKNLSINFTLRYTTMKSLQLKELKIPSEKSLKNLIIVG